MFQQLNSPRIDLPSCAGGTGLSAALYARLRRFLFAYKKNGKVWIWFQCVSTIKLSMYEFPGLRGGNRLAGGSLRTVAAIFVCIQVERKGVCQHFYTMYISLGLRRENRLPGGSLLTVVAIFVRIQVEQKGGNLVAAFF